MLTTEVFLRLVKFDLFIFYQMLSFAYNAKNIQHCENHPNKRAGTNYDLIVDLASFQSVYLVLSSIEEGMW